MRAIFAVVMVLAVLWGGYWFFGASRAEDAAAEWFARAPQQGLEAEHSGISVSGFPNRFDLTVSEPQIADRQSGLGWRAPFLQLFALSYRPHHIIVAWPNTQEIVLGGETIDVASTRMQASAVFAPMDGLSLDRANMVVEDLILSGAGNELAVEEAQLATRTTAGRSGSYDIAVNAAGVQHELLPTPASLVVDAVVQTQDGRQVQEIALRNLSAVSGAMQLRGDGTLNVSAEGLLSGRINLRATGWREMLRQAVAMGLVAPELAPTYENAMALLAGMSGDPDTLEAPITFNRGLMTLGPLPIGSAPRIVQRQ